MFCQCCGFTHLFMRDLILSVHVRPMDDHGNVRYGFWPQDSKVPSNWLDSRVAAPHGRVTCQPDDSISAAWLITSHHQDLRCSIRLNAAVSVCDTYASMPLTCRTYRVSVRTGQQSLLSWSLILLTPPSMFLPCKSESLCRSFHNSACLLSVLSFLRIRPQPSSS